MASVATTGSTTQTRDVNAANEITSSSGIITPTYDAAGNMTSDGTYNYKYDAWDRLVEVHQAGSGNALVATYRYDAKNERITKTLANGPTTEYFYNSQWQVVEERTGAAVDQYVWDQSYVDSPIVRFHDGNGDGDLLDAGDSVRYYTWDANHNVTTTITNVTGGNTTIQHVVYDAYGKAKVYDNTWTTPTDPTEDGPLYCGYMFDAETGSDLARNRYYSVTDASWFTRDPIAADVNLYRYCGNAPTVNVDPNGLEDTSSQVLANAKKILEASGKSKSEVQVRMRILENLLTNNGANVTTGCSDWACTTLLQAYGVTPGEKESLKALAAEHTTVITYNATKPCDESKLLPGDQVWLKNLFYTSSKDKGSSEEGSNTFVMGRNDKGVLLLYNHTTKSVMTIDDYRQKFMGTWRSVRRTLQDSKIDCTKKPYFRIQRVRYPGPE